MKVTPYLFAGGILLLAGLAGWQSRQKILTAKAEVARQEQLVRDAGFDPDQLADSATGSTGRPGRVTRVSRAAEGEALAMRLLALGNLDNVPEEQGMAIFAELFALDGEGLKALLAKVRSKPGVDEAARKQLIQASLMAMASNSPALVLKLWIEDRALIDQEGFAREIYEAALAQFAENDPLAALDWIRQNRGKHTGSVSDMTKSSLVRGVAQRDPAAAFAMIEEFHLGDSYMTSRDLMVSATTPESQSALLTQIRDYMGSSKDPAEAKKLSENLLYALAAKAINPQSGAGATWLNSQLTPEESQSVIAGLKQWNFGPETQGWVEWLALQPDSSAARGRAKTLLRSWASSDYDAVASWVDGSQGPTRNLAIQSLAPQVAAYHPETAAAWADSLPEGPEKQSTLNDIYKAWSKKDPAAAEKFANERSLGH